MAESSFEKLIVSESKKLRSLHEAIHETVGFRDRSPSATEAWRRACENFHTYESRLDPYVERAFSDSDYKDQETIEFVISFLELDPRFFRSGYIKEEMLRKIGRAELSLTQRVRLGEVLLDAVARRGGREFRKYCHVAAQIWDDDLLAELRRLSSQDGSRGSRAKMMLRCVEEASLEK